MLLEFEKLSEHDSDGVWLDWLPATDEARGMVLTDGREDDGSEGG